MTRSHSLVLSTIATIGVAAMPAGANAQQATTLCRPGSVVACTFLGKPGTKKCIGEGEYDACQPLPPPPPAPVSGVVFGKYLVLTVIYAPPGTTAPQTTTGQQSTSSVSYETDSTTGSTQTVSTSFKQDYQVSAKLECSVCVLFDSAGVSFDYTQNMTNSSAINVSKKTSSTLTDPGPVEDGVDHNFDQIWLFLHPKYDVTITGTQVTWTLDPDQSAGVPVYLYSGWLKNPSQIPAGVLLNLQGAGVAPTDYQTILAADPLAECLPPVNALRSVQETPVVQLRPPQGTPPLPIVCRTPTPAQPRYVATNTNLPYEPPFAQGNAVPLQIYSLDNSTIATNTGSYEADFAIGMTASGGLDFLDVIKDTLTVQYTWTVQDINTVAAQTSTEQKASLSMGGPAFGYSGPATMDVYYDTVYQTFAFVPTTFSPDALHGAISSSQGKPVAAQLVTATAGGVKYRTYTDAKGEYHFSRPFAGPIDVQAGSSALHLPALEAGKSVDVRLK